VIAKQYVVAKDGARRSDFIWIDLFLIFRK